MLLSWPPLHRPARTAVGPFCSQWLEAKCPRELTLVSRLGSPLPRSLLGALAISAAPGDAHSLGTPRVSLPSLPGCPWSPWSTPTPPTPGLPEAPAGLGGNPSLAAAPHSAPLWSGRHHVWRPLCLHAEPHPQGEQRLGSQGVRAPFGCAPRICTWKGLLQRDRR